MLCVLLRITSKPFPFAPDLMVWPSVAWTTQDWNKFQWFQRCRVLFSGGGNCCIWMRLNVLHSVAFRSISYCWVALTELGAFMRTEFLCISVLRVALGPRLKLANCKSALNPPVVCSTDRSKAVVPVLVLLFVALWQNLLYVFPWVILFLCFSVLLVCDYLAWGTES